MSRAQALPTTGIAFSLALVWQGESAASSWALGATHGPALVRWEWLAGLGAALFVAILALGLLWFRHRRARRQFDAVSAELGSVRRTLSETEARVAALARRLDESKRLAAVGTMSAQIAHQLRNPLTSMGLYIQLLGDEVRRRHEANDGEAAELLERVLSDLHVMVEITDHYLQYARLPEPVLAAVDVNQTVGGLVNFLRHEIERKGVAVSTHLAAGLSAVEADRRLLGFAVMNLLKNALEAMGSGGRLRVKTFQENGAVEIQVSDTGPGIPAAEAGRVFEPFYTTKESGSGLGLPLSQQIIEKHRGTLTCQSLVGVGTTFTVRLPARAGEGRANHGGDEPRDGPGRG